jgi:hypothetical protein
MKSSAMTIHSTDISPGFDGVYASAEDAETCLRELREVLEEWIMGGICRRLPLPTVDGITKERQGLEFGFRNLELRARPRRVIWLS